MMNYYKVKVAVTGHSELFISADNPDMALDKARRQFDCENTNGIVIIHDHYRHPDEDIVERIK
jgi:hypothetical protein